MIHGLDTSFLVAAEVVGHPNHAAARSQLQRLVQSGDTFALTPQVLAEFIHIITDPRRFSTPLAMPAAIERAALWWNAVEVVQVFPNSDSTLACLAWLAEHQLGRKRLRDTQLAATLRSAGVTSVLTLNRDDFKAFGCFTFPK